MADPDPRAGEATTANYGWTKPNVGDSDDAWGGMLNADLDGIDSTVKGISNVAAAAQTTANAALPIAGGTLTGPLIHAADPTLPLGGATKQYVDGARLGDNRIINGDMRIDQRGLASGSAQTAAGYVADRWQCTTNNVGKFNYSHSSFSAAVALATGGFGFYGAFASTGAYAAAAGDVFCCYQAIEADFISDFCFGAANAQPVTLSFWASTANAGTYSGALRNAASNRSYPFTFVLPANTWTKVVITIPGDTAGTWSMSGNGTGLQVLFDFGCGSTFRGPAGAWAGANYIGATGAASIVASASGLLNLTGVKLEIGSIATPFNRQSLTKNLADCQRYFEKSYEDGISPGATGAVGTLLMYATGVTSSTSSLSGAIHFKVTKRAIPTVTMYSPTTGASGKVRDVNNVADVTPTMNSIGSNIVSFYVTQNAAGTAPNFSAHWTASAEL